ncbi:MAG: hypothetical protein LBT38_06075 [Deltaproteobacteria bacterium]|jgi:hypothetical protein|nr:hypothetical protein [Deltaproteobacteria bacterium]
MKKKGKLKKKVGKEKLGVLVTNEDGELVRLHPDYIKALEQAERGEFIERTPEEFDKWLDEI